MTQIGIREARASFVTTKSVRLICPFCAKHCEAEFPYGATVEDRMRIRHDIITEHARVCPVATAEVTRVWTVEPPRA